MPPPTPTDLPVSDRPPYSPSVPGILAAVDGSDGSLWALDRAMTEAELFDLPLYVLSVVNPSPGGYTLGMAEIVQESVDRLLDSMRDGLRRSVAAVQRARTRPYTGPISLHVVLGNVIETVLTGSAHHHTLVVGSRGNGGFARLLLGSVSTAAAHHSGCPVLIVPAPPADHPAHNRPDPTPGSIPDPTPDAPAPDQP
ncbi:universal stress protein [Streptomyces sp. NPDC092296]|uniref:universal stress protein n=1 Tax=Streptomyces sp. NPDC092296 TaxID=3366012 RepID=UPI003830411C